LHFQPTYWWLYAFLGYFVFAGILQSLSPYLLSLFTKIESLPNGSVRSTVENLANNLNLEYKDIYLWKISQTSTKANAAVTGFGSSLRIILGDTLVKNFRSDEIEIVMAHEIAHQQHKDIYRGILFTGILALIAFYLIDLSFEWAIKSLNFHSKADPASIGYVIVSLLLIMEILGILQLWHIRSREKAADLAAIKHLPNYQVYESAFARLGKQNLAYPKPSRLEVILRYSHPPIKDRIKYAKEVLQT
jgi:STE24 endopeptidase